VGGIVTVPGSTGIVVIAAGLAAAVTWNLVTWARGLPASSGHALGGGLAGAEVAAGGTSAINWGGLDGWHPVGVLGTLVALAISPLLGTAAGFVALRSLRRALRRGARRWHGPVRGGSWATSAMLAFGHGSNDAQKSVGVIAGCWARTGARTTLGSRRGPPWPAPPR